MDRRDYVPNPTVRNPSVRNSLAVAMAVFVDARRLSANECVDALVGFGGPAYTTVLRSPAPISRP